ncbi:MAG: hypothetical protein K2L75_03635, partial [Muribaculaceae bacterium]|nr:hypothetical protein [Muribaculaceae bacterium]
MYIYACVRFFREEEGTAWQFAYLREASAIVARSTNRAMSEPQKAERVTGKDSHAFFFYYAGMERIRHFYSNKPNAKILVSEVGTAANGSVYGPSHYRLWR